MILIVRVNITPIIIIKHMNKMIDIHTHILPQIDDGASSVEVAFEIIKKQLDQEIATVVCTPHFDASKMFLPEFIYKRAKAMEALKSSQIQLLTGSETVCNECLFHYSDLSPLCIEHTRYLLLELPVYGMWEEDLYYQINELMNHNGIYPIIAHIERYDTVRKSRKTIQKLIQMGCMIQMNADSVLELKRGNPTLKWIKKGYVDILASDCHNTTDRPPNLNDAYQKISHYLGNEYCEQMQLNCKLILEGKKMRGSTYYII